MSDKNDEALRQKWCEDNYNNYKSYSSPYLEWDKEGNIIRVSDSLIKKCGFQHDHTFKEDFKNVNDFFRQPTTKESIEQFLARNEDKLLDYPVFIRTDVSTIHALADIEVGKNGNCIAIIHVESQNIYQGIVEKSPDGIFVSTEEGKFSIVTARLVEIYGYDSIQQMLAVDISSEIYCESEDRKRLLEQLKGLKPGGKIEDFKFTAKRKNGQTILISKNVYPVFYQSELICLYGYVRNISQNIGDLDNPIPTFACDLKGNIFHANQEMSSWLGYSSQELEVRNITELDLGSDPQYSSLWLKQLQERRSLHDIPAILTKNNGDEIKVFVNVSIFTAKTGNTNHDVYIKGWLSDKPGGPVSIIWIERLKELLHSDRYNISSEIQELSISAVYDISKQLSITHLDEAEIHQIVKSIKRIVDKTRDVGKPQDNSKSVFLKKLTEKEYSLRERIQLDLWHSLHFFSRSNELLKDALTGSQVSGIFKISQEAILAKVEDRVFFAVDLNGKHLFPVWQFDLKNPSGIVKNLPSVLTALEMSDLAKLSWLMNPNSVLEGRKPFEILNSEASEEDKQRVLQEAYGVGRC